MEKETLLIDEHFTPLPQYSDLVEFQEILTDFVDESTNGQDVPVRDWLQQKMQSSLPDHTPEQIAEFVEEIVTTIEVDEEQKQSLDKAVSQGRSVESWLASSVKESTSYMSAQQQAVYLNELDEALRQANERLTQTITTLSNEVSRNPNLDGYIAEQYHAQTFNLNATAKGSEFRAEVLEPQGTPYSKNGVDIQIKDANGKVVGRYQSKYCKDPEATQRAFENGDYRGQQKLVPEGQEGDIRYKNTTVLKSPDGTVTSNPLSKETAKQMRDEAQSGQWNDLNWNEYKAKDLAIGIGKNAAKAGLQGAAIGVGMDIAQKLWKGEEIKGKDVLKTALTSGADFATKSAVAGALKVGVEKGIIKAIPKGTPAGTLANIAFVAVEDCKIIYKMAKGELTAKEGFDQLGRTTVSTIGGMVAMGKGASIGASVGSVFGPIGSAIGGFIGGTIGYIAGSKVGEYIYKGAKAICKTAWKAVKSVGSFVGNCLKAVGNFICDLFA